MVSVSGVLVDTGYGTFWPAVAQDLAHYTRLAVQAGFEVEAQRESGRLFFLEVRRRADQTEQGTPNGLHAGDWVESAVVESQSCSRPSSHAGRTP